MAKMNFDEDSMLDEPCLSCEKSYIEDIWFEWCCDEKECMYKIGSEDKKTIKEKAIERVCEEVNNLCKKADLEFFFCTEGRSEWSVSKSTHLSELVDCHKKAVEKEEEE